MIHINDISEFKLPGDKKPAPNGKASHLDDRLYALVRTPEFKRWFGDWENDPENASKIVDANGEPLVVYHGTASFGFKEFLNDYNLPRNTDNETNNLGIWFCSNKKVAEKFIFSGNGGVYECFVNMRNPKVFKPQLFNRFEIEKIEDLISEIAKKKHRIGWSFNDMTPAERTEYGKLDDEEEALRKQLRLMKHADSFEQFMNYRDKFTKYIDGVEGEIGHWMERMININKDEANKKLVKDLKDNTHDGIVIVDTVYDAGRKNSHVSQYCVFNPQDIKSIDNRGTFDPSSKNIHESKHVKGLDEFDI